MELTAENWRLLPSELRRLRHAIEPLQREDRICELLGAAA
jgi:hypothetical protein